MWCSVIMKHDGGWCVANSKAWYCVWNKSCDHHERCMMLQETIIIVNLNSLSFFIFICKPLQRNSAGRFEVTSMLWNIFLCDRVHGDSKCVGKDKRLMLCCSRPSIRGERLFITRIGAIWPESSAGWRPALCYRPASLRPGAPAATEPLHGSQSLFPGGCRAD